MGLYKPIKPNIQKAQVLSSGGADYRKLKKTITINILDFEYLPIDQYHNIYHLREDHTNHLLTDVLEIHFLELPKLYKENENLEDPLVDWLLFLKGANKEILEVLAVKEPAIRKACTVLEFLSQDEEAKRLYEMREKALHDEASLLGAVEEATTKLANEKAEIAKRLLKKGLDVSFISEMTDLSELDVKKLKESLDSQIN